MLTDTMKMEHYQSEICFKQILVNRILKKQH